MLRISLILLLLTGSFTLPAHAERSSGRATLIADAVQIGWTKAQVKKALGEPTRTANKGNIWYYGQWAIQFTNGKVSGFPGGAG